MEIFAPTAPYGYGFTGWTTTGAGSFNDATSYNPEYTAGTDNVTLTANYKKLPLATAVITANNRTYDGTTKNLVTIGTITGGATGTAADIWFYKTATLEDGDRIDGIPQATDADTYELYYIIQTDGDHAQPEVAKVEVTISPMPLDANVKAENKVYDETTDATVSATVSTGIEGQNLKITGLTGTFADANVGTGKTVNINSTAAVVTAVNSDTKVNNFDVKFPATTTADITQRIVKDTPGAGEGQLKVDLGGIPEGGLIYNGEDQYPTITVTVKGDGKVIPPGEYVITIKKGDKDTDNLKDAGDYTIIIKGKDGGNYEIDGKLALILAQKKLDAVVKAADKVYDGLTTAYVSGTIDTGIASQTLKVSGLKGDFEDEKVGDDKTVTVDHSAASIVPGETGTLITNYLVNFPATTKASITAPLTTATVKQDVSGIRVVRNDTGVEVPNDAHMTEMTDGEGNKTLLIDRVTIEAPADASATKTVGVTMYIPAQTKYTDKVLRPVYGVGTNLIVTDANVPVTDIYLPETAKAINIADHGFRLASGKTARIHTPLPLFDDYALCTGLRDEYHDSHVMTTLTPANYYWTFSCGIDVYVPKDVLVYICKSYSDNELLLHLLTSELVVNDYAVIKHNNGVILECSALGKSYDMIAYPGRLATGTAIVKTDARDYEGNLLEPVIEDTNYKPEYCYVLKENIFHTILNNDSKVKACHAIVRKPSPSSARKLYLVGGNHTTGIDSVEQDEEETTARWYDLQGRRIDQPTKAGIYIQNGKKVIIK